MGNSKELDATMYREYEIAEWHEKGLVLGEVNSCIVIKDLEDGKESPLVALAKLPFPQFARIYLSRFEGSEVYLKDPAFTYKLFLMSELNMRVFCERLRNPNITHEEIKKKYGKNLNRNELNEFIYTPLDVIPKIISSSKRAQVCQLKYLYLTQYITFDEAKKMGLSIVPFLEQERQAGASVDGYELEQKLATLNTAVRLIFVKLFGLYGHSRMSIKDISKEFGIPISKIEMVYDLLIPPFLKTLGDFKSKTGYVERDYAPGDTIRYKNKTYRELDLDIQIKFIFQNVLSETEKLVLSARSNKEVASYIAYKYLYHDRKEVEQYLSLGGQELEELGSMGGLK